LGRRRSLIIIGCGGFGRETAQAALDGGFDGRVRGFLDDSRDLQGGTVAGLPVLGPIQAVGDHPDALFVVATGRPDNYTSRHAIVQALGLPDESYATVIHPRACLGGDTLVGPGSVVLAAVVATAGVSIGRHVCLMPQVVLTHDSRVDDFCTVASAVTLAGGVRVGTGAYLGAGTQVRQGLSVGDWSMTGIASTVLKDIPARRLWFGSPAVDHGPSPAADYTPDRGKR